MNADKEIKVLHLNLNSSPKSINSFIDLLEQHKDDVLELDPDEDGVYRPWNLLLVDSIEGLANRKKFYASVLTNQIQPKVILLLTGVDFENNSVELDQVFVDRREVVRIIAVTDSSGCELIPGSNRPESIAYFEGDPVGKGTLEALTETLSMPEIFSAVFASTENRSAPLWSIGTKQIWFGGLTGEPMLDAIQKVGEEINGRAGQAPLLRKVERWSLSSNLLGLENEPDIFVEDGEISASFKEANKAAENFQNDTGVKNPNRKVLFRLGRFPSLQKLSASKLLAKLEEVELRNQEIFSEEIDASDGFDFDEIERFANIGMQLNRDDDSRNRKYGTAVEDLRNTVVNRLATTLSGGFDLQLVRHELSRLIKLTKPRNNMEILNGLEGFEKIDGYESYEKGYEGVSLNTNIEKVKKSLLDLPKGLVLSIARVLAGLLEPIWLRTLLAFIYLWVVLLTVFEIFDNGKTPGFFPNSEILRRLESHVIVIFGLAITVLIVLAGLVLSIANERIRHWGESAGALEFPRIIRDNREFIERVAVNDWVLYPTRSEALNQLRSLEDAIIGLERIIQDRMIQGREELSLLQEDKHVVNKNVREDLSEFQNVGEYANLSQVRKIVRTDILQIMKDTIRIAVFALEGERKEEVIRKLLEDLEVKFAKQLRKLVRKGPLNTDIAVSAEGENLRRDLAEQYWKELDNLHQAILEKVLLPESAPVVQLVSVNDLIRLSQDDLATVQIRFSPQPSRENFVSSKFDYVSPEVTFTNGTHGAGVLRLLPFREGVVTYLS